MLLSAIVEICGSDDTVSCSGSGSIEYHNSLRAALASADSLAMLIGLWWYGLELGV